MEPQFPRIAQSDAMFQAHMLCHLIFFHPRGEIATRESGFEIPFIINTNW